MSSIFKGREIEELPLRPYHLREVAADGPIERPAQPAFEELGMGDPREESAGASQREGPGPEEVERERIDRIEKEAYEKAFRLGEKAGIERGERMFRSAVQSLTQAAEQLRGLKEEFYQRVEGEIVDLVLATARKVVQREMDDKKDAVLRIVKEAIAKAVDRERIRVTINPADFDFVHAHKADIVQAVDGIKHLVIEKDESICRGGAIVESDYGTIDARIERQFDEVEKALRRQVGEKHPAPGRDGTTEAEKGAGRE
ncbi:MAG: hypothetical protein JRJ26_06515 [Deltaproteobacteria bacterium]|nr:hypothetical protein [Deltaproteobacteria bacterium]